MTHTVRRSESDPWVSASRKAFRSTRSAFIQADWVAQSRTDVSEATQVSPWVRRALSSTLPAKELR
jgi:hypothetical protein